MNTGNLEKGLITSTLNKEEKDKCGVFSITSNETPQRIFIGSANNLVTRFYNIKSQIMKGKFPNSTIQSLYDSGVNFTFNLITECKEDEMESKEYNIIIEKGSFDPLIGFNLKPKSPTITLSISPIIETNITNDIERIQYYMATNINTKQRTPNLTLDKIITSGISERDLISVITMERPSIKGMCFSLQPCRIKDENLQYWN